MNDYNVNIMILLFVENGIHYYYSPELDLYGYGKTEEDAKSLFNIALDNFFEFSKKESSLKEELKNLGWSFISQTENIFIPGFNELTKINEDLVKKILPLKPILSYRTIIITV